jgi:hypothetical protein
LAAAKSDAREQSVGGHKGIVPVHALEPAVKSDRIACAFVRKQTSLLGHETDAPSPSRVSLGTEETDISTIRPKHA